MGLLWERSKQIQLRRRAWAQEDQTASLAERVAELERQIRDRDEILEKLIGRLETTLGQHLDGDGTIGRRAPRSRPPNRRQTTGP
jgi:hypothetical protein